MSSRTPTCDSNQLEALLECGLNAEQERDVMAHLDVCERCRYELESRAAEPASWGEAKAYLTRRRDEPAADDDGGSPANRPLQIQHVLDALAPTDDPQMLGRLGGYEVSGVVGTGGMGVVLKAHDNSLDRTVAIKVLAPHLASSGAARKRFSREAKAAAAVLHPNVMAIHSVSNGESLPYLVMPYVRGQSLQKRIDEEGPLRLQDILRIGTQIAAGLSAAHQQGLVHRDIKPANILLEDGVERVAITDFGLARAVDDATMTRTGVIAGTPQYMSPEQARGESVDQRSDLFSLGSVLYTMCTGRPPFRAETSYGILRRITDTEPRPIREINPDVPAWLCEIIGKLMAKQPEDRFALARELADLLGTWLAHLQQPDVIPPPERVAKLAVSGGDGPKRSGFLKCLAGAAFAFTMLFAGILIVLDRNKGTLTIECDVDDVSVRITRGEEVVKRLTVTRSGESVRIAADRYVVELAGEHDGLTVEGGHVTLTRGGSPVVKIRKSIDYQVGAEQISRTVDSARVVAFSELQQKGQRHVQLDRVSVEGDFDLAGRSPGEFFGGKAEVVVEHDHQTRTSLEGKVTFVNPLANADGNFCVQVAVENRQVNGRWLLVPGDAPKLTIHARVGRGQKGLTENQVKVPRTVDSIEPLGAVVPTSRRQDPAPRNSVRAVRQMYAKLPCDILGFAEPSKRFVVAQKIGTGS